MQIHIISIFPEIFDSFTSTSLIQKAITKKTIKFHFINPRKFCKDKHKKIDDEIYGWWQGLLMKAQPIIQSVNACINKIKKQKKTDFKIIFPSPSKEIFTQDTAHKFCETSHLIFVCGRYEGIDYRFEQYFLDKYPENFQKISIGQFITLGWETPSMIMIEAITRLIPWVIKEEQSRKDESYDITQNMQNLEYPQYTRPEKVYWYTVPEILLNWHHKRIQERKEKNTKSIKK